MDDSTIPAGYCQCGCGKWLGFWEENDASLGRVKGVPKLWARGHNNKVRVTLTPKQCREAWETAVPHIPYGFCWCGCGQRTRLASGTQQSAGVLQGEPYKYKGGHQQRGPARLARISHGYGWIPLSQNEYALVDAEDAEWLSQWRWYFWDGYARRNSFSQGADGRVIRKSVLMHRAVLGSAAGAEVDHKNRDGLDNRRSNLRPATHAENMRNRVANGRSPYKGVHWHKVQGKWVANITIDGQRRHLGYFRSETDAAKAYDLAAIGLHGQFARLNFPRAVEDAGGILSALKRISGGNS